MKLTHFLLIAAVVAGLGIFGLSRACKHTNDDVPPPKPVITESSPPPRPTSDPTQPGTEPTGTQPTGTQPTGTQPTGTQPTQPAGPSDLAARSYDAEVIAWSKRSISGDKMKDATKGKPYKLNLYKDAGMSTVNRAKIDLDRDDKFDEKYTFETTKITLQRAPNDDEQYSEIYHWNGSGWTKE